MGSDLTLAYRRLVADVYELAAKSRSTSDRFARRHGQTAARWHVLSVVGDDSMTVPQIANRLGLARQSVQRVVNDMIDDRLLVTAENPQHRRSHLVTATPRGRALTQDLFAASEHARTEQLRRAGVTADELLAADRTLRVLISAIGDVPDTVGTDS